MKNGIYGEMFVAAMLAIAATTNSIEEIISGGLAEIPQTSRLYESVMSILDSYDLGNGTSHTDIEDLSNDEVVDFDLFRMVCSAIARAIQ